MLTVFLVVPLLSFVDAFGPPEIVVQNGSEVWFRTSQMSNEQNKFSLYCYAIGDPEKYEWYKDGKPLVVDNRRIIWEQPGYTGTITFLDPRDDDQGYYQCFVKNNLGTAISNKMRLRLGVLVPFKSTGQKQFIVEEGDSLTIKCDVPFGIPPPKIIWIYRDAKQSDFMKSVNSDHITVDGEGNLQFSYVALEDAQENLRYQCGAISPVLQDGIRFGDEVKVVAIGLPRIKLTQPHILYLSPTKVVVKAGTALMLMCIFGGRPLPVVRWSKLGGDLPLSRIRNLTSSASAYGKMLIIDKALLEDAGTYECSSGDENHQMDVTITAAPYWKSGKPKDVAVAENDTVDLNCFAAGDPPPETFWLRNGKILQSEGRFNIRNNGRTLRILNVDHPTDTGIFQCNSSNTHGYVFENIFVKVLAYAPTFKMPTQVVNRVIRNTTVYMPCEVDAAPKARVRWVDTEDRPVKTAFSRIHIFKNNTLRILATERADEGLYYCNVSNKYGINRAVYELYVYNPTHFVKVPYLSNRKQEAHQSFNLDCLAVTDPRLQVKYTWKRNGYRINETKNFRIDDTSLQMIDVRGWHSGRIECIASSGVDEIKTALNITIIDVPATPEVRKIQCGDRQAIITWDKPNEYGDKIYEYTVEQHITFQEGQWKVVEKLTELNNHPNNTYQAVVPLSPWAFYKFRVTARNKHGESNPGYGKNKVCGTSPTNPYINPDGVEAEGDAPDNLVIRWRPLEKIDWNGPDLEYLVRYRFDDDSSPWKQILIEDPLANVTIIRDQPTYRRYLVQVKAINEVGESIDEPKTVIGYSGEDVPLESPFNFTVIKWINWTATVVGWAHVDPASVRGNFRGYLLEYWLDESPFERTRLTIPSDQNFTALTKLYPVSNYTAHIVTINKRYQSTPPSLLHFATPEGLPSKVHNMRVRAVGARTFFVTWERCRQPNGAIRGYFIKFEDSETGETEETFVLNRRLHYLYEKAKPDTAYRISVWAETNAGEGSKVVRSIRTWPLKEPDIPVFDVHVLTPYQADVTWHPANGTRWLMPGSSFYVNYSSKGADGWLKSDPIKLPETKLLLRNLSEGTVYSIVGVAKEGNLLRLSDPVIIKTPSNGFFTKIFQGHIHGTAWFISTMCVLLIATFTVMIMCCCQRQHSGKYPVKRKEIEKGCFQPDSDEHKSFMEYQYGFIN